MTASDLAPQTCQGARQASIRAITGTANTYEGDWHALFDLASIPSGAYEGRLLSWINRQLGTAYASLPEAQQAYATAQGAYNWTALTSVFTPTALGSSLLGFWDAERADLITQAAGLVSSWRDVVAGYDMSQPTGSAQPAYSVTGFNSRPGITLDGVDDCLATASVPFPTGANACEIWALTDQTALAADAAIRVLFSYGGNATTTRRQIQRASVTSVNRARTGVGISSTETIQQNSSVDFSGRHVLRGVIDGANVRMDVDGTAGTAVAAVPATGTTRSRIGANTSDTAAGFYQGVLSAILVTTSLSATQAAQLYAYLNARR